MKDYNFYLGSLTDYLLDKNISNESVIGILLDFKVCWETLGEYGDISSVALCEALTDIFYDYSQADKVLLSAWMLTAIIEHPIHGAYQFIN
jgi:hypothetical protein